MAGQLWLLTGQPEPGAEPATPPSCSAPSALASCSSATLDLVANTKADPLDILARTFALPYAVLADGLTLGNGKSLGSHSSAGSDPPARRVSAAAAERARWNAVPEVDWNDVAVQLAKNSSLVVVKRRLERSIGTLMGENHATCENGDCLVTTRIRCEKIDTFGKRPKYAAEFIQGILTTNGAPSARIEDHSPDVEDQRWWVYNGSKLVVTTQGFCDNETNHLMFIMRIAARKDYQDE